MLPDDCGECEVCGYPVLGGGLCESCERRAMDAEERARLRERAESVHGAEPWVIGVSGAELLGLCDAADAASARAAALEAENGRLRTVLVAVDAFIAALNAHNVATRRAAPYGSAPTYMAVVNAIHDYQSARAALAGERAGDAEAQPEPAGPDAEAQMERRLANQQHDDAIALLRKWRAAWEGGLGRYDEGAEDMFDVDDMTADFLGTLDADAEPRS